MVPSWGNSVASGHTDKSSFKGRSRARRAVEQTKGGGHVDEFEKAIHPDQCPVFRDGTEADIERNPMTPRELITKQRRPYVLAAVIGLGVFTAGLLLNRLIGKTTLAFPDGRCSVGGWFSFCLVIIGVAIFLLAASLLSFRGDCPKCGKNMGPTGWRRRNYCPLCGVHLDAETTEAGMIAGSVLKKQRKEWALHIFIGFLFLLNFALMSFVMILFMRILQLEMNRYDNAKIVGRYYAQACRNQSGEDAMRKICVEELRHAQTSNYWDKVCLPSDEEKYRNKVLDTFEKELARIKSGLITKETVNQ